MHNTLFNKYQQNSYIGSTGATDPSLKEMIIDFERILFTDYY